MESSKKFVEEMSAKYPGVEMIAVENPEEGCRKSDIIVTVTLANEPLSRPSGSRRAP